MTVSLPLAISIGDPAGIGPELIAAAWDLREAEGLPPFFAVGSRAVLEAAARSRGPLPADTMFHAEARATYDAAICMYHDQALIPIKVLDFDEGVNVTLGLPIVRTSPDHGTAFGIAGQGTARPGATIAAIRMAGECAARRASVAT